MTEAVLKRESKLLVRLAVALQSPVLPWKILRSLSQLEINRRHIFFLIFESSPLFHTRDDRPVQRLKRTFPGGNEEQFPLLLLFPEGYLLPPSCILDGLVTKTEQGLVTEDKIDVICPQVFEDAREFSPSIF